MLFLNKSKIKEITAEIKPKDKRLLIMEIWVRLTPPQLLVETLQPKETKNWFRPQLDMAI